MGFVDLVQQRAADVADTCAKQIDPAHFPLEEGAVQGAQRLAHVLFLKDNADVALRRSLGNGKDVDAVLPQGIKCTA